MPLVLLSPENTQDYFMGWIDRDKVCMLQTGVCNVAKHER
jgi:hypothetical protein